MLVVVVVGLVAAVGAVAVLFLRRPAVAASTPAAVSVHTATVQRTDLANSQSFAGTLGFGDPRSVKGQGSGVVTRLPTVGQLVGRGQALYWADDQPVPVFFGTTPLFRTLDTAGTQGSDVAMVESNLIALGFYRGRLPADPRQATLTTGLLTALKDWQGKVGLPTTGTLAVGQVLVLPGTARVSAVTAQLGDPVTGDLLSLTGTDRQVTISAPAEQAGTLTVGAQAAITLPIGGSTTGKVAVISAAAPSPSSTGGNTAANVQVTITPDDQQALGNLTTAAVTVQITTVVHRGVLAVPIGALLALQEGGYALQLPDDRLLPVHTGLFTDQLVEVSGPGVVAGLRVVTAS